MPGWSVGPLWANLLVRAEEESRGTYTIVDSTLKYVNYWENLVVGTNRGNSVGNNREDRVGGESFGVEIAFGYYICSR